MPVVVESGKHGIVPPRGTVEIMMRKLREAHLPTDFTWMLRPRTKTKGTAHTARFKAMGFDENRKSLEIRIQSGNNDTAWLFDLIVPNGMPLKQVFDDLRDVTEVSSQRHAPIRRNSTITRSVASPTKVEIPKAPVSASIQVKEDKKVEEPVASPSTVVSPVVATERKLEMSPTQSPQTFSVRGFAKDDTKVGLALLALMSGHPDGEGFISIDEARSILRREVVGNVSNMGLGSILSGLAERAFIEMRRSGLNLRGVKITPEGKSFVGGVERKPTTVEVPEPPFVVESPIVSSGVVASIDAALEIVAREHAEIHATAERLRDELAQVETQLAEVEARRSKLTAARELVKDL